MKPIVKQLSVLIAIVLAALIIGFEVGLQVSGNTLMGLLVFGVFIAMVFWFLWARGKKDSSMERARNLVMDWWRRVMQEELQREGSMGFIAFFDDKVPHYGFCFKRESGYKAGQWMTAIVRVDGGQMDIAHYDDAPSVEGIDDPFKGFEGYIHRSPVPVSESMFPRYLDNVQPYGKRNRGVKINIGSVGRSEEPKQEGD